jgi:hypothetical protein
MTWMQLAVLGLIIFVVGAALEATLKAMLQQLKCFHAELQTMRRELRLRAGLLAGPKYPKAS